MTSSSKISTVALRRYLQQRYLKERAANRQSVEVDPLVIAHNGERGGHKLLNNVYVLAHSSNARKVQPLTPTSEAVKSTAEEVSNAPNASADGDCTAAKPISQNPRKRGGEEQEEPIVVLLGHKARGFGAGLWNGFGGKVDVGHDASITASAARELEEEVGIRLVPSSDDAGALGSVCRHVGILFFQYPVEKQPLTFEVHIYCVDGDDTVRVHGVPTESEEMNPVRWFPCSDVPIDQMWADDPEWLPQLLSVVSGANPASVSAAAEKKDQHNLDEPTTTTTVSATASTSTASLSSSQSISKNIDAAAFVGYLDFSSMTEVRGSCVLIGRKAVAEVIREIAAGGDSATNTRLLLNSHEEEEVEDSCSPLLNFENTVCPIHS